MRSEERRARPGALAGAVAPICAKIAGCARSEV